jgi:hypothetical protein
LGAAIFIGVIGILPLVQRSDSTFISQGEENIRFKGSPQIELFKKLNGDSIKIESNSIVNQGDQLMIRYHSKGKKYGMIFSIDGNNRVTTHFPINFKDSTKIESGQQLLPFAYTLDDAPEYEIFYFITDNKEIDSKQIINSIKQELKFKDLLKEEKLNILIKYDHTILRLKKGR